MEDTMKFLQDARKGRTFKFALSSRGNRPMGLLVRKKGSFAKLARSVKELQPGRACFGTVSGKGAYLEFRLSAADGFTSEPVKALELREFIREKFDLKVKVAIVLVESLEDSESDS